MATNSPSPAQGKPDKPPVEGPREPPNVPSNAADVAADNVVKATAVASGNSPRVDPPIPTPEEVAASIDKRPKPAPAAQPESPGLPVKNVSMSYGSVKVDVPEPDVESHKRAGWTTHGPDDSAPN